MKKAIMITNFHCNLNCSYCNVESLDKKTISTQQSIEAIKALANKGIRQIHFIGGEPFVRKDLVDLLAAAKSLGLRTVVHTNCKFVRPMTSNDFESIDEIVTCLNGTKIVHESSRGKDTYEITVETIKRMSSHGITVAVDYILMIENCDWENINHVMHLAKELNFRINFQPVFEHQLVAADAEYVKDLKADQFGVKQMFGALLERYDPAVMVNSTEYLAAIARDTYVKFDKCEHGHQSVVINPYGKVSRCFKYSLLDSNPGGLQLGWSEALNSVPITDCTSCSYSIHAEDNFKFCADERV